MSCSDKSVENQSTFYVQ